MPITFFKGRLSPLDAAGRIAQVTPPTTGRIVERPSSGSDELVRGIGSVEEAARRYADDGYSGNFLNENQIDGAQREVAQMVTAGSRLYEQWQRVRQELPSSAEIENVIEPPTVGAQLSRVGAAIRRPRDVERTGRFRRLVQLNERVRRTSEMIAEVLPMMRKQILHARHYERNCDRLYCDEPEQLDRLRDAEDMRLELEQTLRAIEGDVDSLRAQAQSLTLYAQTLLTIQVQLLTVVLLVLTAAGVVAAFLK
jgi:hypothetical protein